MAHPIPDSALDDRLFFGGTSGSGKTYGAGTAVERLLSSTARVVIPDPLGVWYGLALAADGKRPSTFREKEKLVIFGGPRGDLPLTEHAGALIGETVAGMAESCILDLSELKTGAAERRFMLAFLTALYNHKTREPLHVVFDEADLWAPQRVLDKEGEAMKLLGMMENICRRGRVKGFIPWLISQRPAVISKNVLSQIDGMIAYKLTSVQDRDAIGDWVQGQADKAEWAKICGNMPTLERGQGLVWLPARGILKTSMFPEKVTFDSSRAPKRGERIKSAEALKPVNLDKLKEKLATLEAETKANDPKALRAEVNKLKGEIATLGRQMAAAVAQKVASDPDAIAKAEERGFEQAKKKLTAAAETNVRAMMLKFFAELRTKLVPIDEFLSAAEKGARTVDVAAEVKFSPAPAVRHSQRATVVTPRIKVNGAPASGDISGPQGQLLQSLAWWKAMGHDQPTRVQAASICGWRVTSGHIKNVASSLKTRGLIDYPTQGSLTLTPEGEAVAPAPDTEQTLLESVRGVLNGPQRLVFDVLPANGDAMTREEITAALGWEAGSGHIKNVLSSMKSMEVVSYPEKGSAARSDWLCS